MTQSAPENGEARGVGRVFWAKKSGEDDWTQRRRPLGTSKATSRNLRKPCEGVDSLDAIGKSNSSGTRRSKSDALGGGVSVPSSLSFTQVPSGMCRRPASTPATERKEPRENSQTSVTNGHCCAFHSARRTMGRAAESFLHRHPATVIGRVATRGRCPCRGFRWISGLDFRGRKQRGSTAPRVFWGGGNDRQLAEFNPHADEITYRDQPARRQLPLARKKNFFLQGQRDPDFGDMKRAQGHENERFEIQLYAVYRDGGDNGQVGARRLPPGRFFLRSWSAIRWSGRPYRRIPALVKAGTPDSREKCTSLPRQQHHDDKIFAIANLAFSPSPPSIKIIWLYFLHHVVMETPGLLICFQVLPTFASHY